MEKNKRQIKPPTIQKKIDVRTPIYEKLEREQQKRESRNKKSNKKFTGRIKALVMAGLIGVGIVDISMSGSAAAMWEELTGPEQKYTIASVNSNGENKPVITVDGNTFNIDENSLAIVDGEIQDGENYTHAYDEYGNIIEGAVDGEFLNEILVMTEEQLEKYNTIYQVSTEQGANVRSTETTEAENIICTTSYKNFVLGSAQETTSFDNEWIKVLVANGEEVYQGYMREDVLEQVNVISDKEETKHQPQYQDEENIRVVDTSKEGNNGLNLRMQPEMAGQVIRKIPTGSTVHIIGDTVQADSREWTEIEYKDETGTTLKGWVATEYLIEFARQEQENVHNIAVNSNGNVTGIDISGMSSDGLRQLLKKGMSESVSTTYGDINTTQVAGEINFVFIKLGASPYGNGEFEPLDYNGYEEQVKVCEELGVPYGFYYYSTAINEEEAQMEADYITQAVEELRGKYDMKYNMLPMTVDVELAGEQDRQYGEDVQELSDAKAHLINSIQKEGISDRVFIYAPGRVMDPQSSDRLIDLEKIKEQISDPSDLAIWLCAPTTADGQTTARDKNYIDLIENTYGVDVANYQIVLDATIRGESIDVNNMDLAYFEKILSENKLEVETVVEQNSLIELIEEVQDDER